MNPYLLINIKQINQPKAPINYNSTKAIMKILTHRTQIICALEAVKMILPIWKIFTSNIRFLTKKQKETPRKAIALVKRWLNVGVPPNKLLEISNTANSVSDDVYYANNNALIYAAIARAAACITLAAATDNCEKATTAAVGAIDYAAETTNIHMLQFYNEWWAICVPLVEKELQDKYELLIKKINRDDI